MKLQILTPEKTLFDGEARSVSVPGAAGPFEILKDHAPVLAALAEGKITVKAGGSETSFPISGGFVEFHGNSGVVLAEGT